MKVLPFDLYPHVLQHLDLMEVSALLAVDRKTRFFTHGALSKESIDNLSQIQSAYRTLTRIQAQLPRLEKEALREALSSYPKGPVYLDDAILFATRLGAQIGLVHSGLDQRSSMIARYRESMLTAATAMFSLPGEKPSEEFKHRHLLVVSRHELASAQKIFNAIKDGPGNSTERT